MNPQARKDGILSTEIGDDVIVYDQESHKVHRLNRTANLVWQNCDGVKTVADLSAILSRDMQLPSTDEDLVWLALDRLEKAKLLKERLARPKSAESISRRQVMRKLATVGTLSLLIPVVQGIVAPTPAMAASSGGCGNTCDPRNGNIDCSHNSVCKICDSNGTTNKTCQRT